MRRLFSPLERFVLADKAGWICQKCGQALTNFHADHVRPYSKGGPTTLDNGQALCPSCNLKKGDRMTILDVWRSKARPCQEQWFSDFAAKIDEGQSNFLWVACPGAGKTYGAIGPILMCLHEHMFSRVVVVSPRIQIQRQWANALSEFGVNLYVPRSGESLAGSAVNGDWHGWSLTYGGLPGNAKVVEHFASLGRTIVILDEVHHCGRDRAWGDAIRDAFGNSAAATLSLSGTPFRSGGEQIEFVTYEPHPDGGMVCAPDVDYSYGQALLDRPSPVTEIMFDFYDAESSWVEDGEERSETFETAVQSKRDRSRHLAATLETPGWLRHVLSAAKERLSSIRDSGQADAAGIVLAKDKARAEAAARALRELGEDPLVVYSEIEGQTGAHQAIANFRNSSEKWIVAVDMISEGADIPRARVLVYATNKRTETYFMQSVGRVIRKNPLLDDEEQLAHVFLYRDPILVGFANEILNQIDGARSFLDEESKILGAGRDGQEDESDPLAGFIRGFEPISSRAITGSKMIPGLFDVQCETKLKWIETLAAQGLTHKAATEAVEAMHRDFSSGAQLAPSFQPAEVPKYERVNRARAAVNQKLRSLAIIQAKKDGSRPDFKKCWNWLFGQFGTRSIEEHTEDQMERAISILDRALAEAKLALVVA
jgi:superfamily II DNA or RNA helicase